MIEKRARILATLGVIFFPITFVIFIIAGICASFYMVKEILTDILMGRTTP